jgi:hypothetical protein
MGIDPRDLVEQKKEREDKRGERLNNWVAVMIALLAAFMGLCSIKDGNIVQNMQQSQAQSIDTWNYYQAKNIRQDVYQTTADDLAARIKDNHLTATSEAAKTQAIYQQLAQKEDQEKGALKNQAEGHDADYNKFNFHDDQFDLSDATISLAISLLAVTALTKKRWLFWAAMIPAIFGVVMGLSGLLGWQIHPDVLIKPLTLLR